MKNPFYHIVILLGIANMLFAQDIPFIFNKDKIDIGTLYVYEYSQNKEIFEAYKKIYIYIKTLDEIEEVAVPVNVAKATFLQKYKINWNYMMLEKMEYWLLKDKEEIEINDALKSICEVDYSKKIMRANFTAKRKEGIKDLTIIAKLKSIPTYFYHLTDLLDLWFSLRFYPDGRKEISINHNTAGYNNEIIIKYMGKEEVEVPYGKIKCNKFELTTKLNPIMRILSKTKNAHIWLASEDDTRYMVKYRNDNLRSTFIRSMEYRLAEVNKITQQEWENIKEKGVTK